MTKFRGCVIQMMMMAIMLSVAGCKSRANKNASLEAAENPSWARIIAWQPKRAPGMQMEFREGPNSMLFVTDIERVLDPSWPVDMKDYIRSNRNMLDVRYFQKEHTATISFKVKAISVNVDVDTKKTTFAVRFPPGEQIATYLTEIKRWQSLPEIANSSLRALVANVPSDPSAAVNTVQSRESLLAEFKRFSAAVTK